MNINMPVPPHETASARDRLETWKEIATYLSRDLRTVKRWEKSRGLPVHRLPRGVRSPVYALKSEVDAWRNGPWLCAAKPEADENRKRRSRLFLLAGASVLAALAGIVLWRYSPTRAMQPLRQHRLTSYSGVEWFPAFSPDGDRIAFSWNGGQEANFDIYAQVVGEGDPLRLTTDPAMDLLPAWSPDGRYIAFARVHVGRGEFEYRVVPALGGAEHRIAAAPITPKAFPYFCKIAWAPDGKSLIATHASSAEEPYRLVLISPASGGIRPLTSPPVDSRGDCCPAFSPDGHTLAFLRATPGGFHKLVLLRVSADGESAAEPRVLNIQSCWNPMWSADGRELLCEATQEGSRSLWRIPVQGTGAPQPLAWVGQLGQHFTIAPRGNRLVYSTFAWEDDIWELDLARRKPPVRLIASTGSDLLPQVSPDGARIAFLSDRSGQLSLWVSARDGSKQSALTPVARPHSPSWSPSGREIAFTCQVGQNAEDICIIGAGGGSPRRLTWDPARDVLPTWSRDGKWIYFASNRSGAFQTWKMPAEEPGPAVRVTRNGGFGGIESPDGKNLYFPKTGVSGALWRLSLERGEEVALGDSVRSMRLPQNFAVGVGGMVYARSPDPTQGFELRQYSYFTRTTQLIARFEIALGNGMSLTPDGRSLLFTTSELRSGDLMMVEGFR